MANPSPVFDDPKPHSVCIEAENQFEYQWRLFNARFEYAWRYFSFHATQRTTMFNFFVVFSGFLINACILLLQKELYMLLLGACIFGIFITLCFVFLERRNEELVHVAEDILYALETDVLFKDFKRTVDKWPKRKTWLGAKFPQERKEIPLGIFIREDNEESGAWKNRYSHGTWLPRVQVTIAFLYLLLGAYALYAVLLRSAPSIYAFSRIVPTG